MMIKISKETLFLTKKEVEILDSASKLLDIIYHEAKEGGYIEAQANIALESISELLSDEVSEIMEE